MRHIVFIPVIITVLAGCAAGDDVMDTPPAALVGSHYGLAVAKGLPNDDVARVDALTQESLSALPDGATRDWQNPESGSSGSISILSSTRGDTGRRCRMFAQKFYFQGEIEKALGEACLDEKNRWILQSKSPD